METSFWHQRWERNEIAFHASEANPLLVRHFDKLSLEEGSRVFLPLCGKTLDLGWLLSKGYRVVGAELSEVAIQQLFLHLGLEPKTSTVDNLKHYCHENIDILAGDIFDVSRSLLGPVEAVYDRAALVALPQGMRQRYTAHLLEITARAPQFLISYEYDQDLMAGPPFSISSQEIHQHYEKDFDLRLVESFNVPGGLKGKCSAQENVWLLR